MYIHTHIKTSLEMSIMPINVNILVFDKKQHHEPLVAKWVIVTVIRDRATTQ